MSVDLKVVKTAESKVARKVARKVAYLVVKSGREGHLWVALKASM